MPVSEKLCNCRKKDQCPLDGKCLTDEVVYRAAVKQNDEQKIEGYVGITGNSFKTRYNQHKSSFSKITTYNLRPSANMYVIL